MNYISNESAGFQTWREQWEETKNCYEALLADPKPEIAYSFFRHCMKLKDYLKVSQEFPLRRINALINCHWELRLCRDICAGKARLKAAPEFLILNLTHIADLCMNRWNNFLRPAFENAPEMAFEYQRQ